MAFRIVLHMPKSDASSAWEGEEMVGRRNYTIASPISFTIDLINRPKLASPTNVPKFDLTRVNDCEKLSVTREDHSEDRWEAVHLHMQRTRRRIPEL
jgi:hypothetical protein